MRESPYMVYSHLHTWMKSVWNNVEPGNFKKFKSLKFWFHCKCSRHQRIRAWRWEAVIAGLLAALRARKLVVWSRFLIVWSDNLLPNRLANLSRRFLADSLRFLNADSVIYRSSRPLLGLSLTSPDSRHFARNLDMVLALTPNRAATSFWVHLLGVVQLLGPLGDSISVASLSYKRPLSKLQLYLTQTLFKANFIFQTKGDNIIHVFGLHQWPPEHHSNTFHPLKKRTLHHWHSCKTCTVTWALFKTHCIFKRNGDFGVENNAFCNISLLTLPYIQEYCTFHDYIITADGTSL